MFNFLIRQIQQPGKGTITTLSILLSVVLWAILKLNDPYFSTISYPCKITEVPKSVLLQSNILPDIAFRVKAKGSTLFWEYWRWNKDTLNLKYQNAFNKGFIVLSANKYAFSHFPEDIEIIGIQEDTIPINLIPTAASKKVPIHSNVKVNLEEGYALFSPPTLSPDSVTIYGTLENISTIQEVQTETSDYLLLKTNVKVNVKLKTNSVFKVSSTETLISFSPEKYTEISPEIKMEVTDMPFNKKVKFFPETLHPNCKVPLSEFEKWTNQTLTWKIPYSKLTQNEVIIPNFDFFPPQLQFNSCEVNEVQYVISEN